MNWKFYNPQFDFLQDLKYLETGWHGHIWFAYDLIANTKPEVFVELGTHFGHSFFSFAQAVKDFELDTKLYAVDYWEGDEHAGRAGEEGYDKGKKKSVYEVVQDIHKKYYSKQNIKLIKKLFNDAVKDFDDNSIDILHIDGLHTYEAVKEDFETWLPKMKKDGIILLHDTVVKERDFGVYKLWEELMERYNGFTFTHSHGLGVLHLDSKEGLFTQREEQNMISIYSLPTKVSKLLSAEMENLHREEQRVREKIENQKRELEDKIRILETQVNIKDKELIKIYSSWSWKMGWLSRRLELFFRKFIYR